ncbi:Uncharacterized protein PCOAH_00016460, partial [Plasmodium coatneyi]
LYKTQLCSFYAKGICARGNKCSWAHGELDVRPMPKFYKVIVSSRQFIGYPIVYFRGDVIHTFLSFLLFCPPFWQTRMCYTFLSGSYCEASKCTFAHTEEELRGSGKALRLCTKYFLDGYCAKADKCPMAHNINQLDPSVKFSSSELMSRMYNGELEEEGDEPNLYKRKLNKKRDGSESNDADNCSGNINGGDPLKVRSNMHNGKDVEETHPDDGRNRYAVISHLDEGEKDAQGSHRNSFNFLRSNGKKTYSEYLLEGDIERDVQKSRGAKGDNFSNIDFTQNGEFDQNGEVAKMGDRVSCREFTYDNTSFGREGEGVPMKFFTYRMSGVDTVNGDHLGKGKLPNEHHQNGFSPTENMFLPSNDRFVRNFGSINKVDKGNVHSNVGSNISSNVNSNLNPNLNSNLKFEMLNEVERYKHLNVQAENYFFNNIKKKEYPENSLFDSNKTTYEHVKSGSNFYSDGMMYLNRTKENLDNCDDLGLRFNYNGGLGVQKDVGQRGVFHEEDNFNCKVMNNEDRFNHFRLENLIQNMNNLNITKKQMATHPLVKTINGESALDGESAELKDTKEGEMGSEGDIHTGEDTHSEKDYCGDSEPAVIKPKDLPPEAEQIYKGASFSNNIPNNEFKKLFLSNKISNHAKQQNGYSGQCHNGVGQTTVNGFVGGGSYANLSTNGVTNLCNLRNVQTRMNHLCNHQNNGTPNSSLGSASSVHDRMVDAHYDMNSIYRKINGQRSMTGVKKETSNYNPSDVLIGQQYPRSVGKKTENYDTQTKKHFFNYVNNYIEGGTTASRQTNINRDGVNENDIGARVTVDGMFLTNGSELPRGSHHSHASHGSHGSYEESGNDTVMKNILKGKTNLYCTPNSSGVNENGSSYNSRGRNMTKVNPADELGRTEELHKMLMNGSSNGISNHNMGDFFFMKNGNHVNGLTYPHGENSLQGTTNSFGDNMNVVGMAEVNYGASNACAVGFTRRTLQKSVAVEGGLLNGGSLHGGYARGNQGKHQNQGYRNDCRRHTEQPHIATYSHPNHLMGAHKNNSPLNPHIDSYEMAYKSDEGFTNYMHNASREVEKMGKTNSVTENGRRVQNEEGLSDGSNQDNKKKNRSYNPLTYSFSGLCECLAKGEGEKESDVVEEEVDEDENDDEEENEDDSDEEEEEEKEERAE